MLLFIIAGIIVIYLIFDVYQRFYKPAAGTKQWPELAKRTGLIYQPAQGAWSARTSPRVMGSYRGYELKLDTPRILSSPVDDGIATYRTRLVLTMNHRVKGSFSLKRRSVLSRWLGQTEEISSGEEWFDQCFIISSQPRHFAKRVFEAPDLRRRFLAVPKLREFSLSNLGVRCELAGIEADAKGLHDLFNLTADVVQRVKWVEQE